MVAFLMNKALVPAFFALYTARQQQRHSEKRLYLQHNSTQYNKSIAPFYKICYTFVATHSYTQVAEEV